MPVLVWYRYAHVHVQVQMEMLSKSSCQANYIAIVNLGEQVCLLLVDDNNRQAHATRSERPYDDDNNMQTHVTLKWKALWWW